MYPFAPTHVRGIEFGIDCQTLGFWSYANAMRVVRAVNPVGTSYSTGGARGGQFKSDVSNVSTNIGIITKVLLGSGMN